MKSFVLALVVASAAYGQVAEPQPVDIEPRPLSAATFDTYRDFITPNEQELGWLDVPWRESFWAGVIDAQRERKPILLWTMNGHPMGCT